MSQKEKVKQWLRNLILTALIISVIFSFITPTPTHAVVRPFGGPIIAVIPPVPFICNFFSFVIGPPGPAIVAFIPGASTLFAFGSLRIGSNVLGDALIGGPCIYADTIFRIGTSN